MSKQVWLDESSDLTPEKADYVLGRMVMPDGKLSGRLYDLSSPRISILPGGLSFVRSYADIDDVARQHVEGARS